MKSTVYDSGDPNLPNLPDTDQILWSDYDDYLSNEESDACSVHSNDNHSLSLKKTKSNISYVHAISRRNTNVSRKSQKSQKPQKSPKSANNNNNSTGNSADSGNDDDDDGDDDGDINSDLTQQSPKNGRRGSLFSMFRIPRIERSSSSYRRKSESSTEQQEKQKPTIKIIQPTIDHMIAAGGDPNSTNNSLKNGRNDGTRRRSRSFSNLPPKIILDEENGYVSDEDDYTDRDVCYSRHHKKKADDEKGRGVADGDGGDYFHSNNNHSASYINDVRSFQPHINDVKENTDNEERNNLKKLDTIKSSESEAASHHVAIDKRIRRIMGTDTDYESDNNDHHHVDHHHHGFMDSKDTGYVPESILKKNNNNNNNNTNNNDDDDDDSDSDCDDHHLKHSVDEKQSPIPDDGYIDYGEIEDEEEYIKPAKKSRKKRRRRRKSRKYAGSQSKKERTAWEPGIDLRTTNVFLNSPGSIITITDYSKTRYRISHYDLYSTMNPKYSQFSTDDIILSGHDFDGEYEDSNNTPEFNEFLEYMNKVSDSHLELETAINNKPNWSEVRWINVNGLSWEAISIIGKKYNLHPLSVEDLVDIPQRTKMDTYQQHLFVVMPLLKLLKIKKLNYESDDSYFERVRTNIRYLMRNDPSTINKDFTRSDTMVSQSSRPTQTRGTGPNTNTDADIGIPKPKIVTKTIATREQLSKEFTRSATTSNTRNSELNRTITNLNDRIIPRSQRILKTPIEGDNEEEHKLFNEIEKNSTNRRLTDLTFITPTSTRYKSRMQSINKMRPLMSKSLAVGIEQVSMYLTLDGTVLTFFEHSAMEIERAILSRLSAEYTILRESCNPSILFHSILDANTDLLYPIITAYTRILNEKEVEILTATLPDLQHTQELHLMLNELSILKNSILPVSSLITQLKDLSIDKNSTFIDESCKLYLADIGDHLLAFIDEIDSMSSTIENLIDLIFNTLSVETNNSMQQLSLVTVLFLPLTFWAGYFGMNFQQFHVLKNSAEYFWKVAVPFTAGMMILLMRNSFWRMFLRCKQLFKYVVFYFQQFYHRREIIESNRRRKMRKRLNAQHWDRFRLTKNSKND